MPKTAIIKHIDSDFPVTDLNNEGWNKSEVLKIKSFWTGQRAPKKRRFETRMLWSDSGLYVRFDANQGERPVVNKFPDLYKKAFGLWDRDVCEIFVAPDSSEKGKYYEFEVAPTGEWVDLAIQQQNGERVTNTDYISGMRTATNITHDLITMAINVKWGAFGVSPNAGDVWLGNLFRCVGKGNTRGYLAWSATRTEAANFHVPERFGEFVFSR